MYTKMLKIRSTKKDDQLFTVLEGMTLDQQIKCVDCLKPYEMIGTIHISDKGNCIYFKGDCKYQLRDALQKENFVK